MHSVDAVDTNGVGDILELMFTDIDEWQL